MKTEHYPNTKHTLIIWSPTCTPDLSAAPSKRNFKNTTTIHWELLPFSLTSHSLIVFSTSQTTGELRGFTCYGVKPYTTTITHVFLSSINMILPRNFQLLLSFQTSEHYSIDELRCLHFCRMVNDAHTY